MQALSMPQPLADKAAILRLIADHRPQWSLDQAFYQDPAIFRLERELWFPRQWVIVAHASEVPEKGSYIVRQLFDEEVIVVRFGDGAEDIRAYYNVCTHRGSRVCTKDGRGRLLVCPYHAWSFRLTGELQTRHDLPEGVDPEGLGLHRVPSRLIGGLVVCGLDAASLPDPQAAVDALTEGMREVGIDRARIAARKHYPTKANWKLVIENFLECYHCRPAHPEYFRVNGHVKVTAVRDEQKKAEWEKEIEAWHSVIGDAGFNKGFWEPGDIDRMPFGMTRKPIGSGRKTLSDTGEPVSRLMGGRETYDGGETGFRVGRLSFVSCANDYVTVFQMIPRSETETNVVATWLVDENAPADIDVDAMTWMWDVTTVQDKKITEDNAAGVASRAYRPGPYTALETQTSFFIETYLAELQSLITGVRHKPSRQWERPTQGYASPSALACSVPQERVAHS